MIPIFPRFSKLKLKHKKEIEAVTSSFPPYSDYNFSSLWSYNTDDSIEVSLLYGNLVVRFTDYLTVKPFYSFIGTRSVILTSRMLLTFSQKNRIEPHLKLVPEFVIKSEPRMKKMFEISEDPDNHDYIVSARHITELPESLFKRKNYLVSRFKRKYPGYRVEFVDVRNPHIQNEMISLFERWEKNAGKSRKDTENELTAIRRLIDSVNDLEFHTLCIYHAGTLVAFTMYEKTFQKHGISAFQKADKTYTGIYAMLSHESAKHLYSLGCTYINYEQDLGIEGLRLSKSLWKPTHFLKKYIVKLRK